MDAGVDQSRGARRRARHRTRRPWRTAAVPSRIESTEGPNKGDTDEAHFTYEFDGVTLTIHWSQSATNCTSAKVTILEDGDLEFSDIVECAEDEAGLVLDQVGMRHWDKIA